MLESTTVAEHEGNLFCKQCYARKFVSIYWLNKFFFFYLFYYRVQKVSDSVVEQVLLEWIQVNILVINLVQRWRKNTLFCLYLIDFFFR